MGAGQGKGTYYKFSVDRKKRSGGDKTEKQHIIGLYEGIGNWNMCNSRLSDV